MEVHSCVEDYSGGIYRRDMRKNVPVSVVWANQLGKIALCMLSPGASDTPKHVPATRYDEAESSGGLVQWFYWESRRNQTPHFALHIFILDGTDHRARTIDGRRL
jgi:phenylacetate-coenzyme A ligase PaaK-like adenylate-forming protein